MFRKKPVYPYEVHAFLNGRHPYLDSHKYDYPSRVAIFEVQAHGWKDAEKVALNYLCSRQNRFGPFWAVTFPR